MFRYLGSNLKKLRMDKDVSLREVARKTGISAMQILNYEQDKCLPNLNNAFLLAEYYGVTVEEMCGPHTKRFSLDQEDTDDEGY